MDVDKTELEDWHLLQCPSAERRPAEALCLGGVAGAGMVVGLGEGVVGEEERVRIGKEVVPVVCDWWTEHLPHHLLLHSHHKVGCLSTVVKNDLVHTL